MQSVDSTQREVSKNITQELEEYNEEMASGGKDVCKEVIIEIRRELSLVLEPSWARPECCIYRVPKTLRKVKEDDYTPQIISIGPLHHDDQELPENMKMQKFPDMEKQKLRYFEGFCKTNEIQDQDDLARIVEINEEEIRRCYEEKSKIESPEYVRMILLDAIFIIELFSRTYIYEKKKKDYSGTDKNGEDYVVSTPWLRDSIKKDLLLLENQLPLSILKELFEFSDKKKIGIPNSFLELACAYFKLKYYSDISQQEKEVLDKKIKHFTDLQRYFLLPQEKEGKEKGLEYFSPDCYPCEQRYVSRELLYSATKLDEAGVEFEIVESKKGDIDFRKRFLEIQFVKKRCLSCCPWLNCSWIFHCLPFVKYMCPCLKRMQVKLKFRPIKLYDESESLYRNVMAFEQFYYPSEAYVCSYFVLLDKLIDTDKDVDFLVDKQIIDHGLGSKDELAKVINELCQEISVSKFCYGELCKTLNRHCKGSWNHIMATMTSTYFKDFWRGTATIVALIALFITLWNFIKQFV